MIRAVVPMSLVLLLASISFAYEVGDVVVVVHETRLKVEGKSGDKVSLGLDLRVTAINGNWLWVNSGHPGWIESEHVVPLERAIPVFSELLRQYPNNAKYYHSRGGVWIAKNEYDAAIADFNEAIRLEPTAAYYNSRGIAWANKNDLEKAIADFSEAMRLTPSVTLFCNRGKALGDKGELDKAMADLNEVIRRDPNYGGAYSNRGDVWSKKQEYDNAIKDFDEALRLDQKDDYAYRRRGWTWSKKGDFAKAIADYEVAIRLDPNDSEPLNDVARIFASCHDAKYRDAKKAVQYATKACELTNWKNPLYIGTLAAAYAEAGDFKKAVEWQTMAINLTAENQKAALQSRIELYKSGTPYREKPEP